MAEGYDPILDYQRIYGMDYDPTQPNWNFHDHWLSNNPFWNLELFPRSSSPASNEQKKKLIRSLPSSSWLFVDKSYDNFKNGLKVLPKYVKVRGVKWVPPFFINGNIVSEERSKKLKQLTFKQIMQLNCDQLGQYVRDNHRKCKIEHSFSDKHELSPQSQSNPSLLQPYDEWELNEKMYYYYPNRSLPPYSRSDVPSVLQRPNLWNMINDEDTPPFNEYEYENMECADWTKSNEADDDLNRQKWSPDDNIDCCLNDISSTSSNDNLSSESTYSDLNLSDLLHHLRITPKEDYMRKHKGTVFDEAFEKYLNDYTQ